MPAKRKFSTHYQNMKVKRSRKKMAENKENLAETPSNTRCIETIIINEPIDDGDSIKVEYEDINVVEEHSESIAVATPAVEAIASSSHPSPPLPPPRTPPIRNNRPTSPRQSLLKARRCKKTTPFERTSDEFADVEKCRLQYEEARDKRLHEREMERLRLDADRTEVAREHNLLLHQLTDIGERLIGVLSKTLGLVGSSPPTDPLLTQGTPVSVIKEENDL